MSDNNSLALPDGTGSREPSPAVSAVPASIPSAIIDRIRSTARDFLHASERLRLEARNLDLRAGEQYDAFITLDLLADKEEQKLASAIEARRAATPESDAVHESAGPKGDAQTGSDHDH